jgi:multimeric flavodoxin WrbA
MKAILLNCTLKSGNEPSSTDKMLNEISDELKKFDVQSEIIRIANSNVKTGVKSDEGDGDGWPAIRKKILDAEIFILGTPIWMGQPGSIAKRVMERMDAFLGEEDEQGRFPPYGIVACAAIVGNEDGAHHSSAEIFQALNDVGFTIPANGMTYWVGEAMKKTDYKDLPETPEETANATKMMVINAVHLAKALKEKPYPTQK